MVVAIENLLHSNVKLVNTDKDIGGGWVVPGACICFMHLLWVEPQYFLH